MFAEELDQGKSTRKRQEDARRRRLEIKQKKKLQQQRQQNDKVSTTPIPLKEDAIANKTVPTTKYEANVSNESETTSAVEEALKQRRIRQNLEKQNQIIIKIQSWYRSYKTMQKFKNEQRNLYDKRMHDIITLSSIIKQQNDTIYIVPPATATMISVQLFYIFDVSKNAKILKGDKKRLHQYFQYVLLPGLLPTDGKDDVDTIKSNLALSSPLHNWLSTTIGKLRIRKLLYLCIYDITEIQDYTSMWSIDVLRGLLGVHAQQLSKSEKYQEMLHDSSLVRYCGTFLVSSTSSSNANSLDILSNLRKLLLTYNGILKTKNDVSKCQIDYNNLLLFDILGTIITICNNSTNNSSFYNTEKCKSLSTRIITEILTTPFLTWKISIHKFISSTLFQVILCNFIIHNKVVLSNNNLIYIIPEQRDQCKTAPLLLCLFSNLVQIGRIIPFINGTCPETKFDYNLTSAYYDLLSCLLHVIPYGALSEKQTNAIEWNNSEVIILNETIIEQSRIILTESWVRNITNHAINSEKLNVDTIINHKNKEDIQREENINKVLNVDTAMTLAVKEVRVNRQRTFWERNSKWALKLGQSMSSLLSTTSNGASKKEGEGSLMNTSSMSRQLAKGDTKHISMNTIVLSKQEDKENTDNNNYTIELLLSLCRFYSILLSRWGGYTINKHDLFKAFNNKITTTTNTTNIPEPCITRLLNVICFSTNIIKATWCILQSNTSTQKDLNILQSNVMQSLQISPSFTLLTNTKSKSTSAPLLYVFLYTLTHVMVITDDFEIHELDKPIPKHQLLRCIILSKNILYKSCSSKEYANYFGLSFISILTKTLRDLYDRSSRKPICTLDYWLITNDDKIIQSFDDSIKHKKEYEEYINMLNNHSILLLCPFLIPFSKRLKLFECIIKSNRELMQGSNNTGLFGDHSARPPPIPVSIMRGRVLEDGLIHLNKLGKNLRRRIAVSYLNQAGKLHR